MCSLVWCHTDEEGNVLAPRKSMNKIRTGSKFERTSQWENMQEVLHMDKVGRGHVGLWRIWERPELCPISDSFGCFLIQYTISWGWDPSCNANFVHISYKYNAQHTKVIWYNSLVQPAFSVWPILWSHVRNFPLAALHDAQEVLGLGECKFSELRIRTARLVLHHGTWTMNGKLAFQLQHQLITVLWKVF